MCSRIETAIATVLAIEEAVKARQFPAWDETSLEERPALNERFRRCVANVVRVYCAQYEQEFPINRTGPQ